MIKQLLLALSILPLSVFAQSPITILSTDMAQIGDLINRKADTLTPITGPGPAGANQTWVMTNISSNPNYILNENTSVITVASTPYAADFTNSNVAMTNDNVSFIYMKNTSTYLTTQGGAGDLLLLGNTIVAPLNPDLLLHNFPRTYNSTFTDNYATDITIDGSIISGLVDQIRYKRVATVTDITDGWGKITTPVGTYDVLRVKRADHGIDTTWILPTIGFPPTWSIYSTKDDTSFSYTWLGKEGKLAIAELGYDSLDQPKTFKWTLIPPLTVSLAENAENMQMEIFPVPASEFVSLRFGNEVEEGEYFFCVYDVMGRMLLQEKVNAFLSAQCNVNVQNLPPGYYSWQLFDGKQVQKKSGKLTIVR